MTIAPTPPETYVSGADLRRWLGVSDSTLRLWRDRGLPHVGGGAIRPRYLLSAVERWLKNQGAGDTGDE